jgi:sterol 3beta-glucosyltransferase
VPFIADQPFWGHRLAHLGVAVPPIAPKNLTAERLAAALRQLVQDQELSARAASLGERIRAENGLGVTCAMIEQMLAASPIRSMSD